MTKDHRTVAAFYNDVYYAKLGAQSGVPDRHLLRLADRLGVSPGQNVLDIACGAGQWLQVAHGRGAEVAGIDISDRAIDVCRKNLPSGNFHVGPAETLPFPTEHFDIVTCLGSLEHFLDQAGALSEMRRVAKPGASILILVPNSGFPPYRAGLYRGTQQKNIRETVRSIEEWTKLFNHAGIEVCDRWRDLHVLSRSWILRKPFPMVPLRCLQAALLPIWPIRWQYQIYHLSKAKRTELAAHVPADAGVLS